MNVLDNGKTKFDKIIDLKKIIEENVLFDFYKISKSDAENKICNSIANYIAEILKENKTIRESANYIGVSYSNLKKFITQANNLKIINYKGINSFKNSLMKNELTNLNDKDKTSIVNLFLKNGSVQDVVQDTRLSYNNVKNVLCEYFKCNNIVELRKVFHTKKEIKRKSIKPEKLNLIMKCKMLYDNHHTLEKVASELKISKEYVRRLLQQGDALGIIEYQRYNEKRFKELIEIFNRDLLHKKIKESSSELNLCEELDVSSRDLNKLCMYFNVDLKAYKIEEQKKKCLRLYSEMVSDLGRHPTTYDFLTIKNGPYLIVRIRRYWGNIDRFRNEFGIDAPIRRLPTNTRDILMKRLKYLHDKKIVKRQSVLNLIKESGLISCTKISKCLSLKRNLVLIYLNELQKDNLIQRNGAGSNVKYSIKK